MSDFPNPGDRVRVTYEATYAGERYGFRRINVLDGDGDECEITAPLSASVEVLERADDPSKDPLDTVRVGPNGAVAIRMHLSRDGDKYVPGWRLTRGSVEMDDQGVVGWRKVGPVPGTPLAAEVLAEVEHTNEFPPDTSETEGFAESRVAVALAALNPICGGPTELYRRIETARDALREVQL